MADSTSDDSVSSWPGFVGQLNQSFNLIRDVFGYALPGAAFLAIGVIAKSFSLAQVQGLLAPYQMPPWMAFIVIIAGCYLVGDVLASVSYSPFMVFKYLLWMYDRRHPQPAPPPTKTNVREHMAREHIVREHIERRERTPDHEFSESVDLSVQPSVPDSPPTDPDLPEVSWRAWLYEHPTEVASKILKIHQDRPKLTEVKDRRETQNLMSASLTGALLSGYVVFCRTPWHLSKIIGWAAGFACLQFLTGLPHLRRVTQSVYAADKALAAEEKSAKAGPDLTQLLADLIKAATAALKKLS